jgi:hypothetical protein
MKITAFSDGTPCNLVQNNYGFEETYCLQLQGIIPQNDPAKRDIHSDIIQPGTSESQHKQTKLLHKNFAVNKHCRKTLQIQYNFIKPQYSNSCTSIFTISCAKSRIFEFGVNQRSRECLEQKCFPPSETRKLFY